VKFKKTFRVQRTYRVLDIINQRKNEVFITDFCYTYNLYVFNAYFYVRLNWSQFSLNHNFWSNCAIILKVKILKILALLTIGVIFGNFHGHCHLSIGRICIGYEFWKN
jgi:hypothetical protein